MDIYAWLHSMSDQHVWMDLYSLDSVGTMRGTSSVLENLGD